MKEARRLQEASALEMVEARICLAREAKDEAIRLRAATDLSDAVLPRDPQVSLVLHASLEEASAHLLSVLSRSMVVETTAAELGSWDA